MTETVARPQLSDRYTATSGRVQLTGVQALARLPIDQHRRDLAAGLNVGTFISGYEGSPLAGYDTELMRMKQLLDRCDVTFVPGLNEEAAATSVQGSQLACTLPGATRDGVIGIWYGKAPGLDRASDALRHGNLMGAHPRGGAVVLAGDDPAAKSSTLPCASDVALADLNIPYLYPADSQEVLDLGRHAIELSRASGLWTGLKIVTAVADGSSTVDLAADWPVPQRPAGAGTHTPTARLLHPTLGQLERDLVTNRLRLAKEYARLNQLNKIVGRGPADVLGIVAAGHTYLDVLAALRRLGIDEDSLETSPVRLLRIGMPWPLEEDTVREFADGLHEIMVVEEKRSFLEAAIRDILYGGRSQPAVTGKRDADGAELIPAYGELDADSIIGPLRRRMTAREIPAAKDQDRPAEPTLLPLVSRVPYFCSGCPHNSSTKPLPGTLVGAGIGCHALVMLMDEEQAGTVTGVSQMGGEGMQWIGMAPFLDRDHFTQNIGDGTFDHSGSLAIRAAVAAGANMTYKLLYNSAVAMTGGQRPASGMTVPQIVRVLLAEGVAKVIVTTEDRSRYKNINMPNGVAVLPRSRLEEAQRILAATRGVTVLVHDQECATEKRRKRKRGKLAPPQARVFINERVCEGCGDCGRVSNCLSVQPVQTDFGRKTRIHQSSCNVDYSCLDGDCPAFMTVVPRASAARAQPAGTIAADELPAPPPGVNADSFGIRLTGVGGTGVVTVSQVLATAGLIAGWHARSLDQTGLAQKGGAVVSDVRFSRTGRAPTNKLGAGECDLYLGCDLLVAADPKNLAVADADRTFAVISVAEVPTGPMVSDPARSFPDRAAVSQPITERVRGGAVLLDVRPVVLGLFGDDQFANVFLVGAGFQTGALPLPPDAIEEALRVNGVAVEKNIQAFRRGRQYIADRAALLTAAGLNKPVAPDAGESPLGRLIRTRSSDLTAYQDQAYARRYLDVIERVRAAEQDKTPGSTALTEAVARYLYQLMAYKDEYEVARLSLDPSVGAGLEAEFGPGARASWRLHPPVLRALGMKRKIALGPWFAPAFRVLRAMRRVRGTRLDPFGRTRVRIAERELIEEYLGLVDHLIGRLSPATSALAVQLASLPDVVRGYEEVKLRNVESYHQSLAELRAQLDAPAAGTP
ncbi:MAG TPA: indolepyruvate ferredoxin oxidoreductase family protein [Streptosporangiaceae bacterium]|nr:indolepyruvate ferredoxin oxidoreductase family protein [Streptosporangiaceae bacterium]